ncbi:hypothetical protein BDB00DRAFT_845726 [Zychaea mexicana]|uniref:uncharacterized protein n=1 Tax=Zychaea mexicana TaxID=64656 RepID=UPI0022FE385D|nr:uncharacterized protein BDB00DRAFT_845726 [Zychaea mexicana]KAI9489009.1 hypothetical protein BDB00DRAFT_845726 [Zychaea mexicana]
MMLTVIFILLLFPVLFLLVVCAVRLPTSFSYNMRVFAEKQGCAKICNDACTTSIWSHPCRFASFPFSIPKFFI